MRAHLVICARCAEPPGRFGGDPSGDADDGAEVTGTAAAPIVAGATIAGRCRLDRILGRGGMGVIRAATPSNPWLRGAVGVGFCLGHGVLGWLWIYAAGASTASPLRDARNPARSASSRTLAAMASRITAASARDLCAPAGSRRASPTRARVAWRR